MRSLRTHVHLALLLSLAAVGCGGDDLVLPDAPGTVQIVDGNGQEGGSGDVLADPLVVRLVNEAGEGIPEQTVRWVPRSGSGTSRSGHGDDRLRRLRVRRVDAGACYGPSTAGRRGPGVGIRDLQRDEHGRRRKSSCRPDRADRRRRSSAPAGTEVPTSSRGPDTRRGRGAGGGLRRHLRRHRRRW